MLTCFRTSSEREVCVRSASRTCSSHRSCSHRPMEKYWDQLQHGELTFRLWRTFLFSAWWLKLCLYGAVHRWYPARGKGRCRMGWGVRGVCVWERWRRAEGSQEVLRDFVLLSAQRHTLLVLKWLRAHWRWLKVSVSSVLSFQLKRRRRPVQFGATCLFNITCNQIYPVFISAWGSTV